MELKDTVIGMTSPDYKERFKAEYQQVSIRLEKLKAMLEKWDAGDLPFVPTCPRLLYDWQVSAMEDYAHILKERAALEDVEL